jgi:hypothetical protein
MKGVFISELAERGPRYKCDRKYEEEKRIMDCLSSSHEVAVHDHLWTVEEILNGMDFLVTNMPFEECEIDTRLPKDIFYEKVYGKSYKCIERICKNFPQIKVIVYTGADPDTCSIAEKHGIKNIIRRGRYGIDSEVNEILRIIGEMHGKQ